MSEEQIRSDIEEGLRQSAAGEVVDLGDFSQYATSEPFRDHAGWDMSLQTKRRGYTIMNGVRLDPNRPEPPFPHHPGEPSAPNQASITDAQIEAFRMEEWKHERWGYGKDNVPRCDCGEVLGSDSPATLLERHRVRVSLIAAFRDGA